MKGTDQTNSALSRIWGEGAVMLGHQLVFPRALAAPMKPRNNGCARLGRTAAGAAPVISKPSGFPLRGTDGDGEKPARAVYPCWP